MEFSSDSDDPRAAALSHTDAEGNKIEINQLCHVDLETGKPKTYAERPVALAVSSADREQDAEMEEEGPDVDLSEIEGAQAVLDALRRFAE